LLVVADGESLDSRPVEVIAKLGFAGRLAIITVYLA